VQGNGFIRRNRGVKIQGQGRLISRAEHRHLPIPLRATWHTEVERNLPTISETVISYCILIFLCLLISEAEGTETAKKRREGRKEKNGAVPSPRFPGPHPILSQTWGKRPNNTKDLSSLQAPFDAASGFYFDIPPFRRISILDSRFPRRHWSSDVACWNELCPQAPRVTSSFHWPFFGGLSKGMG
jgi:hypothetical protein